VVILCCYASLQQQARSSVKAHAPAAVLTDTSASPFAYWHAIERYWTGRRDLAVIEQDIEITPDVIPGFDACPAPWCTYAYQPPGITEVLVQADSAGSTSWAARVVAGAFRRAAGPITTGLGCTRFSAALQRDIGFSTIAGSRQAWDVVDTAIASRLEAAGYWPHIHGQVTHHHGAWTLCVHRGIDPRRYSWHYAGYPTTRTGEL
jgi:hypothetical protein